MALDLTSLDDEVRAAMVAEFDRDREAGRIHLSPRLSEAGQRAYPALLRDALARGDDATLARALHRDGILNAQEDYAHNGATQARELPKNAAELIAEGQFNRYYMRGLCVRAIATGIDAVEVYRAKQVHEPRPESERLIGKRFAPADLLADLRAYPGDETPEHGVPGGPNSGISVRLPTQR